MSDHVKVGSIDGLRDLRLAFRRFGDESRAALDSADQEIRRTFDWLKQRATYWQTEVRRAEARLEYAQRALALCLRSGDDEHPPDCRGCYAEVQRAQRDLEAARYQFQTVVHWTRQVGEAAANYQRQAQRLAGHDREELPKAIQSLDGMIRELEGFVQLSVPASAAPSEAADIGVLEWAARSVTVDLVAEGAAMLGSALRQVFPSPAASPTPRRAASPTPTPPAPVDPDPDAKVDALQRRVELLRAQTVEEEAAKLEAALDREAGSEPEVPPPDAYAPPLDTPRGHGRPEVEAGVEVERGREAIEGGGRSPERR